MATNSASRKASERGKSVQTCCTSVRSSTDKNQNSNWQMCQRGIGMAMNSASRKASERGKSAQRRCTAMRSCTDKNQNSNWRMCQRGDGKATNSVSRTASECAQVSAKALHSRAQLHGQEPKQQLADVPKKGQEGDELGQPKRIRTRQVSERRCTVVRGCTDKNQNSNWRMCQRSVGKATNSVGRTASECAASQRKGVVQPSAVARTRTQTATGRCTKEASGWQRSRSAEQHQNAASQRKVRCSFTRKLTEQKMAELGGFTAILRLAAALDKNNNGGANG
jgi:hypothetical protein